MKLFKVTELEFEVEEDNNIVNLFFNGVYITCFEVEDHIAENLIAASEKVDLL